MAKFFRTHPFLSQSLFLIVLLVFLLGQLLVWHIRAVGIVLFFLYVALVGNWAREFLHRAFHLKLQSWLTLGLGWFFVFVLLGLFSSILVAWYRLTPLCVWSVFASVGFFVGLLVRFWKTKIQLWKHHIDIGLPQRIFSPLFAKSWTLVIGIVVLLVVLFIILFMSTSHAVLTTPWQTIPTWFLYMWVVVLFLVGFLVYSKQSIKVILFILIAASFVQHAYLPLTHVNPWGGDVWRHVGVEIQLQRSQFVNPTLFGPDHAWEQLVHGYMPAIFLQPQKYAYGNLWGITVLISDTLDSGLLHLNMWLVPIVWSLMLPLLLFYFGRILFDSWRSGLVLGWLSLIPYSWQALGGLTLPNSLGFVIFLFVLLLWFLARKVKDRRAQYAVIFLSVLLLFGYSLYAILLWAILLITWFVDLLRKIQRPLIKIITTAFILSITILFLPVFALFSFLGNVPTVSNFFSRTIHVVTSMIGWTFARHILPATTFTGNFFYNHILLRSFVSNIFTNFRWHVFVLMIVIWIAVIIGLIALFKKNKDANWHILGFFTLMVCGGYGIGWVFFDGTHTLIRRLDPVIVLVMLFFFVYVLALSLSHIRRQMVKQIAVVIYLLLFSWFGTTTYASGPNIRVVSSDEAQVAHYLVAQEVHKTHSCVLADTWELLVIEGISGRQIIGGGFPINSNYAQPQRVWLYQQLLANPYVQLGANAEKITYGDHCWFVLPKADISTSTQAILSTFASSTVEMNTLEVWHIGYLAVSSSLEKYGRMR